MLWRVNYDSGYMSIIEAENQEKARRLARQMAKEQDWVVRKVTEATEEDIDWVKGMGGGVVK